MLSKELLQSLLKYGLLFRSDLWVLIFSFFDEAVGFVAEHKWALTAFVARLTGTWVMQKKKKKKEIEQHFFVV